MSKPTILLSTDEIRNERLRQLEIKLDALSKSLAEGQRTLDASLNDLENANQRVISAFWTIKFNEGEKQ